MGWNHRILAHETNGEVWFQMHEVYYADDVATSYTAQPSTVGSDGLPGIRWTLNKMRAAWKKPVLWAGAQFPNEYQSTKESDGI